MFLPVLAFNLFGEGLVAELSRLLDEPGLWADLLGTSSRSTGRNGSSGKHSRPRGARLRDPTR
jgi:hypothetical protein